MNLPSPEAPAPRHHILAAFAAVYLVWGSTYLAIRVAVETLPPFLLGGVRFVVSALLLLPFLLLRGHPLPTARQWGHATVIGVLLMLGGNGLVVWAEQTVTSSQAALFIASTPVWFAIFDWLRPGGTRPSLLTGAGLALGFIGVITLVSDRSPTTVPIPVPAALSLLAATICWAAGSVFSRHADRPASPLMGAAAQMLTGGVGMLLVGGLRGEFQGANWIQAPFRSWFALGYLILFGSLVGYTAYVYLLRRCPPTQVATYAYVNPVIAVLLGHLILGEPLGARSLVAGALVVAGVILLTVSAATWRQLFSRGLPNPSPRS
jgi:drug/metabolite transporter (DMT)-like permease